MYSVSQSRASNHQSRMPGFIHYTTGPRLNLLDLMLGVNQVYSRLSTTHGHITDCCKLDSVVYAGVCVWVNVDLSCLDRTIYARQLLCTWCMYSVHNKMAKGLCVWGGGGEGIRVSGSGWVSALSPTLPNLALSPERLGLPPWFILTTLDLKWLGLYSWTPLTIISSTLDDKRLTKVQHFCLGFSYPGNMPNYMHVICIHMWFPSKKPFWANRIKRSINLMWWHCLFKANMGPGDATLRPGALAS